LKKYFTLFFILILISSVKAQSVGGGFLIGSPQGEFKSNVGRIGFGFQIQGALWAPTIERPYTIGLDASYLIYGIKTETMYWGNGYYNKSFDVTRTNSIASLHLLFQVNPFFGPVQPYIEGVFGGAYIFTLSEVKSNDNNESLASSTNLDDFTWSYGAGAGVLVQIAQDLPEVSALFLDFKVRYTNGTEAKYLTENDIEIISPTQVNFYPRKSKTDLLTFQIGIVAYF
jgi:hypothetical protein